MHTSLICGGFHASNLPSLTLNGMLEHRCSDNVCRLAGESGDVPGHHLSFLKHGCDFGILVLLSDLQVHPTKAQEEEHIPRASIHRRLLCWRSLNAVKHNDFHKL